MSDMCKVKGKLVQLSKEEKDKIVQDLADNAGLSCEDILDDINFYTESINRRFTFITDDETLFEIVDFEEDRDPDSNQHNLQMNPDGTVDFDVYWYNCCGWEDLIGSDLKELLDSPSPEKTVTIPEKEYQYYQDILEVLDKLPCDINEMLESNSE